MSRIVKHLVILLVLVIAAFAMSNHWMSGSLQTKITLADELMSPPDSIYRWNIGKEAPFKYRILHHAIVSSTYHAITGNEESNEMFFQVYKWYCLLFEILAAFAFYFLMRAVQMDGYALAGAAMFVLLPPFLWAYDVPVHTREDMLGYMLLLVGLIGVARNSALTIATMAVLGVLCRETLLILPFINLIFNKAQNIYVRFSIAVLSFLVFVGLRFVYGLSDYDSFAGLRWNLSNLIQVAGFAYLTFGFLWFPFLLFLFRPSLAVCGDSFIFRSAPLAFILIFGTAFAGAIFNEIRIIYLFAPWMIIIGISCYHDHQTAFKNIFKSRNNQLAMAAGFVVMSLLMFWLMLNHHHIVRPSAYMIPYDLWLSVGFIQLYLGCIALVVVYRISRGAKG